MKVSKIYLPDKKLAGDEYLADFEQAKEIGKVFIGNKGLYYKDGLKMKCIPLEYIDRVFTRINECNARTCCTVNGFDYFRLIVVHDGKEIGNIIFGEDEAPVDEAEKLLKELRPEIEIGYIKQ